MNKELRCVLIIPYFGKIPDYFHLWLKSAEANPKFTFFVYSDLPFPVAQESNVKVKKITFKQLQERIREKLGKHCKVREPYKLCDYRPAYGYLFAEDIKEYDFWGFCDIDLIFGNLEKYLTQEVLRNHDKLFMHGHFCLLRNNPAMNRLFLNKYPNIVDFNYISRTNYSCHFDENGTIAWAPDCDPAIRFIYPGPFYDVPSAFYPMMYRGTESCAIWESGRLIQYWNYGAESRELMYIHLQKRKMENIPEQVHTRIVMLRNQFLNEQELFPAKILSYAIDQNAETAYIVNGQTKRKQDLIHKLKTGALKFRFYRSLRHWKSR